MSNASEPAAPDELDELDAAKPEPELVDSSEPLLEQLLAAQSTALRWRKQTEAGFSVELARGEPESLRLVAPNGTLCATIVLDPAGPRLEVRAAELHASASERVSISAERVEINASEALELRSGGSIRQRAAGEHRSEALAHRVEATHGEIELIANDDVALEGEHIRLNSPAIDTPAHLRKPPP